MRSLREDIRNPTDPYPCCQPWATWWWDEHLAACSDFRICVSDTLGNCQKGQGLTWAEGKILVLLRVKVRMLRED